MVRGSGGTHMQEGDWGGEKGPLLPNIPPGRAREEKKMGRAQCVVPPLLQASLRSGEIQALDSWPYFVH